MPGQTVIGDPAEVVLHGTGAPVPQPTPLRAGPLSVLLDGIDLRYARLGDVELARRIYVAVRDRNWNTIPGVASEVELDRREDSFEVHFAVRHGSPDVDFSWSGEILGTPEGEITFRMAGAASREMLYNRIGFCVLHPWRETAGQPFRGETPSGPIEGRFPRLVAPQRFEGGAYVPLFASVSSLAIALPHGGEAAFEFEGDLFETEDQRNWTDASFKTYCTPLALGFPHELRAGDSKVQAVRVSARGAAQPSSGKGRMRVAFGAPCDRRIPPIGLALAPGEPAPSVSETRLLATMAPAHLRFDLHVSDPEWTMALRAAIAVARSLSAQLEVALFVPSTHAPALGDVQAALDQAPVARVLVSVEGAQTVTPDETTPGEVVRMVRAQLGLGPVPVAGGTDMYFCELNRTRPEVHDMDGVFWSLNPQVHAFDDISLLETPEAQGEQVRTARQFAGDRPLFISPVTLRRRYNVNATAAESDTAAGLPDSVDPRQVSLIAAAWTLASAKNLSETGAGAITYFEAVGWRGVIQGDAPPPRRGQFHAVPGQVFPLFHVLADVASLRGCPILPSIISRPLEVAALAAQREDGSLTVLVANLTPNPLSLELDGVSDGPSRVRRLDAQTARLAVLEPDRFRRSAAAEMVDELSLMAYATVRIDTQP